MEPARTSRSPRPTIVDVREQSQKLDDFGVLTGRWFNIAGDGTPVRVSGAECTASLLRLLGVQPLYGRLFRTRRRSKATTASSSSATRLWQSHFAGEPDVVGRQIPVDGGSTRSSVSCPQSFEFPTPWGGRDNKPALGAAGTLARGFRATASFGGVARLAEEPRRRGGNELKAIAAELAEAYPDSNALTRMWIEPMMRRTLGRVQIGSEPSCWPSSGWCC